MRQLAKVEPCPANLVHAAENRKGQVVTSTCRAVCSGSGFSPGENGLHCDRFVATALNLIGLYYYNNKPHRWRGTWRLSDESITC
jgi:hypothetical protein